MQLKTNSVELCVTFFSAKADSALHPYGVNDSYPLNTTVNRLQWATLLEAGSNGPHGSEKDLVIKKEATLLADLNTKGIQQSWILLFNENYS